MRRIAILLGALAAAGTVALLPTAQALAATGPLDLGGQTITNPSGCYNSAMRPLIATNSTDHAILVFQGPNCTGAVEGTVAPGQSNVFQFGTSVYVP